MKKTEREMLVLAAKAAGMAHMKYAGGSGLVRMLDPSRPETTGSIGPSWNPLNDDGDAMRLAAKLKIDLEWQHDDDAVEAYVRVLEGSTYCPSYPSSEYRRAIVDVAAHIGESMP